MTPNPSIEALRGRWQRLKPSFRAALVMAVVVVLWIGSGLFKGGDDGHPSAADAGKGPVVPTVRTQVLTAMDRQGQISLFGRTKALRGVTLKAETGGEVETLVVAKGARVAKGDEIIRLAMDDRSAKLAEALAHLDAAQIDYDGAKKLSKQGYRSRLKLAESKSNLEAARARMEAAQLDADRTAIRAPFGGIVDDIPVEIGDALPVGGTAARLIDLSSVLVTADISERYAAVLALGASADVMLGDGRKFQGHVRYVSRSSQTATRTFPIEIIIDTPSGEIAEGLTAEVRIWLNAGRAHKITPAILALSDGGIIGVKSVSDDNMVHFIPVELVADTPEGIWVSGLPDTVRLIVVGQDFVRDGQKVTPVDSGREGGGNR